MYFYTQLIRLCLRRTAIVLGTAIPLVLFLVWNAVILGSITDPNTIAENMADPLQQLRDSNGVVGVSFRFIHMKLLCYILT